MPSSTDPRAVTRESAQSASRSMQGIGAGRHAQFAVESTSSRWRAVEAHPPLFPEGALPLTYLWSTLAIRL